MNVWKACAGTEQGHREFPFGPKFPLGTPGNFRILVKLRREFMGI